MSESIQSNSGLTRMRVFAVGTVLTSVLCGLVVLCVPKKPEVIADAAAPQALPMGVENVEPAGSSPAIPQGPASLRSAPTGEKLYSRFCAGCHGADGKGQTTMARMMKSPPTNFVDGPWKGPQSLPAIMDIVKNGRGAMPGYGKEISSDAELEALAGYVLSLGKSGRKQ